MTASNRFWQRHENAMAITGTVAMIAMIAGCASQTPAGAVPDPGPQGGRGTPEGCQADKLGDDALIGKTEAEAAALLKGCAWRFGNREGQHMPATMDYNPQRRTIDVLGGKVTAVRRG